MGGRTREGVRIVDWFHDQFGGGSVSHAVVGRAALAVAAGVADVVVCYRAINARSEFRMASGATRIGGVIPVNTHGGFLSEGYVHGINHIAEVVAQLRGTAGVRQVPGAEVALSTAQPGYVLAGTSALILRAAG